MKNFAQILRRALPAVVLLLLGACAVWGKTEMIIVVGASGEAEYGAQFAEWSKLWQQAGKAAGAEVNVIGPGEKDRELLEQTLAHAPKTGDDPLWLVLIGHGTFDGEQARFNLRGADFSARELRTWLAGFARPLAVLDLSAASAPFLGELSGPRRVVITAARSGAERDFAHFGGYLSAAIGGSAADLDKDGRTSLLEAFLFATRQTAAFYAADQRLATEHALLDDNADGQGSPAEAFTRFGAPKPGDAPDPRTEGVFTREWSLTLAVRDSSPAEQKQRARLEAEITALRQQKPALPEAEYYRRLEALLLPLARLDQGNAKKP